MRDDGPDPLDPWQELEREVMPQIQHVVDSSFEEAEARAIARAFLQHRARHAGAGTLVQFDAGLIQLRDRWRLDLEHRRSAVETPTATSSFVDAVAEFQRARQHLRRARARSEEELSGWLQTRVDRAWGQVVPHLTGVLATLADATWPQETSLDAEDFLHWARRELRRTDATVFRTMIPTLQMSAERWLDDERPPIKALTFIFGGERRRAELADWLLKEILEPTRRTVTGRVGLSPTDKAMSSAFDHTRKQLHDVGPSWSSPDHRPDDVLRRWARVVFLNRLYDEGRRAARRDGTGRSTFVEEPNEATSNEWSRWTELLDALSRGEPPPAPTALQKLLSKRRKRPNLSELKRDLLSDWRPRPFALSTGWRLWVNEDESVLSEEVLRELERSVSVPLPMTLDRARRGIEVAAQREEGFSREELARLLFLRVADTAGALHPSSVRQGAGQFEPESDRDLFVFLDLLREGRSADGDARSLKKRAGKAANRIDQERKRLRAEVLRYVLGLGTGHWQVIKEDKPRRHSADDASRASNALDVVATRVFLEMQALLADELGPGFDDRYPVGPWMSRALKRRIARIRQSMSASSSKPEFAQLRLFFELRPRNRTVSEDQLRTLLSPRAWSSLEILRSECPFGERGPRFSRLRARADSEIDPTVLAVVKDRARHPTSLELAERLGRSEEFVNETRALARRAKMNAARRYRPWFEEHVLLGRAPAAEEGVDS